MVNAVIVETVRTPIGRHGGIFKDVRPDDLAALALQEVVKRAGIDPAWIEEVYMGCANQAGEDNRNVARMAALLAGFPKEVSAVTVNRLCASGLTAINQAARAIKAGEGDVYVAGGVESMTRAPFAFSKSDTPYPTGNAIVYDTTLGWRFPNERMKQLFPLETMGETAENIAALEQEISRQEQDEFALESHRRAVAAMDAGKFAREIVAVPIPQKKGDPKIVDTDEHPRRDTTLEKLASLKPAYRPGGSVTAGNASGINDGAAAVLLMSEDKARELGLKPRVRMIASAAAGVDPRTMGYGPMPATEKALKRAGLTIDEVGLIELNEAFAIQALAVMKRAGFRHEITNVNGGAIALGHPLGSSGARLMTTLVHEMERRAPNETRPYYGLVTLCVGVGQGETTLVEWIGD